MSAVNTGLGPAAGHTEIPRHVRDQRGFAEDSGHTQRKIRVQRGEPIHRGVDFLKQSADIGGGGVVEEVAEVSGTVVSSRTRAGGIARQRNEENGDQSRCAQAPQEFHNNTLLSFCLRI